MDKIINCQQKTILNYNLLPTEVIFWEAIAHCRWKTVLRNSLPSIHEKIEEFSTFETFEDVFKNIKITLQPVNGIGPLSYYDISSAICKYHNIEIKKIYLFGGGPKRAIRLLNIPKSFDDILKVYCCERVDVLKVHGTENMTSDDLETSLCLWQKTIK